MNRYGDTAGTREGPVALPVTSRRLFAHYSPDRLCAGNAIVFVIGRLLEEGETADLRWLVRTISEDRLVDWLRRRGGRQLTRRSRSFWLLVLGCPLAASAPALDPAEIWPL